MKFFAYAIAIFTDLLQVALFLLFWALEPLTGISGPLGTGLDMAISIVSGFTLMLVLWADGAFYPGMVMGAFIGEEIPVLDALIPFWTILVWRSQSKKRAREKAAQEQAAGLITVQSVQAPPQAFDGIRAANDNQSYAQQAA